MPGNKTADFQKEVDRNYEAFLKLEDGFDSQYSGMYALMKNKKVIELFSSWQDARKTAKLLFKDEPFSIQKVKEQKVDLGFYSHAIL